jgi:hypothetical protein
MEIQCNFDYPSPDYPPVSVNRHGGEPQFVAGVGGNAHACVAILKVIHPAAISYN